MFHMHNGTVKYDTQWFTVMSLEIRIMWYIYILVIANDNLLNSKNYIVHHDAHMEQWTWRLRRLRRLWRLWEVPRAHIHTFVFNRPVLPGTDNGGGVGWMERNGFAIAGTVISRHWSLQMLSPRYWPDEPTMRAKTRWGGARFLCVRVKGNDK